MLEYLPKREAKCLNFKLLPKSLMLQSGKYIVDKHFGKIDLRVPYTNGDELKSQIVAIFGCNPKPEEYDSIIDYIKNQLELVKVTDIPVFLNTNEMKNGYTGTTWFYGNNIMEEDYYRKLPVCVKEISIEGNCDEESQCIYVHEMMHALSNRHKGSIKNLLNDEVLSIFMEKIAAYDLDQSRTLLDKKNLRRILQIKHNILDREILEFRDERFSVVLSSKTYILSALRASALFDIYLKGSQKVQNEIDKAVANVITGNDVLEDMLDHYGASLEKGTKVLRRQIKEYHNKIY